LPVVWRPLATDFVLLGFQTCAFTFALAGFFLLLFTLWSRNDRCADFQFKRSKVNRTAAQYVSAWST